MTNDAVIWTVVIICKIIILLAILFCCTNNRRKRRNIAYQQAVITPNVQTHSHPIVTVPYQQTPENLASNGFPRPHQYYQQPNRQFYNPTDDLPPTYAEAVNENYTRK
ncbi:hypothetical protein RN001_000305 [Aquatica leii]|uniref:Uncharacterized protein n=1 Tax=Aquatica leii TaxID=1421715 RepID=A0AAN7PEQ9_9COLE|nr:hypothetical protein RN001_000305 [Aquatica leii]